MPLLQPHHTALCYRDITPDFLHRLGVSCLLLDIDNTLAPYEQPTPDGHITAWHASLAAAGIHTAFVSNNHPERVELFNQTLQRPFRCDAHKPLPRRARQLMISLGADKKSTALMGDQIFTDVLCAKLLGARAILVPPIKDRTDKGTRFKRYLERGPLRRFYRRHPDAPDIRAGSPLTPKDKNEVE